MFPAFLQQSYSGSFFLTLHDFYIFVCHYFEIFSCLRWLTGFRFRFGRSTWPLLPFLIFFLRWWIIPKKMEHHYLQARSILPLASSVTHLCPAHSPSVLLLPVPHLLHLLPLLLVQLRLYIHTKTKCSMVTVSGCWTLKTEGLLYIRAKKRRKIQRLL